MEVKNNTLTEFQSTKLLFLKKSEYSESTETTYWRLYLRFLSDLEIEFNKDLYDFSQKEINCYKEKIKSKSKQTIFQTNTFINRYMEWYAKYYNEAIKIFNLDVKKQTDNSWYLSKDDFFDMINKMIDNNVLILNLIPLLLARYGILGKEAIYIRNIKWKDINFRNNKVLIYNKNRTEILSSIPIDNKFIEFILKIRLYEKELYKGKKIKNRHIVKSQIEEDIIVNYSSLNSKVYRCFKDVDLNRISLKVLFNCALIDYIKDFYSHTVPKSNEELAKVLSLFYVDENVDIGRIKNLKNFYAEATGDSQKLRTYGRS